MADTIYAKGIYFKTRETNFGKIIKADIKVEDFVKFLQANANEKGYVKLDIQERKEESEKGETHYAKLDTWKPSGNGGGSNGGGNSNGGNRQQSNRQVPKQQQRKSAPADDFGGDGFGGNGDEDDIPF